MKIMIEFLKIKNNRVGRILGKFFSKKVAMYKRQENIAKIRIDR